MKGKSLQARPEVCALSKCWVPGSAVPPAHGHSISLTHRGHCKRQRCNIRWENPSPRFASFWGGLFWISPIHLQGFEAQSASFWGVLSLVSPNNQFLVWSWQVIVTLWVSLRTWGLPGHSLLSTTMNSPLKPGPTRWAHQLLHKKTQHGQISLQPFQTFSTSATPNLECQGYRTCPVPICHWCLAMELSLVINPSSHTWIIL